MEAHMNEPPEPTAEVANQLLSPHRINSAGDYDHINGRTITPPPAAVQNLKQHLSQPTKPPAPKPKPEQPQPTREEVLGWHDMYMAGEQIDLIIKTAQLSDPLKLYSLFRQYELPLRTAKPEKPKGKPKKGTNGKKAVLLSKRAKELYARYLAGERVSELAREEQIHLSTLYLAFKRLNLPLLGENHQNQQKKPQKPKKQPPQVKLETQPAPQLTAPEATLSDIPFPAPLGEGVHIPFDTQTPPLHNGLHIPYTIPTPQAQQLQQLKESLEALGCEVTLSVHIKAVVNVELAW